MKKLASAMLLVAASVGPAFGKTARCYVEYLGNVYIDGQCEFSASTNGSFDLTFGEWWVTVEVIEAGWADGRWNGDGDYGYGQKLTPASHQHAFFGYLRRDGACWSNREAKICAW
ncbi:hypothetical protein [Leisingera sp. F5]|uniref:hypothetical protein n=1 Tax=Leisingera sp. F5 TaxID=1813816 RepID=UPI0025C129CF|nr:hypothetical protein [Leisingera sp. F5]